MSTYIHVCSYVINPCPVPLEEHPGRLALLDRAMLAFLLQTAGRISDEHIAETYCTKDRPPAAPMGRTIKSYGINASKRVICSLHTHTHTHTLAHSHTHTHMLASNLLHTAGSYLDSPSLGWPFFAGSFWQDIYLICSVRVLFPLSCVLPVLSMQIAAQGVASVQSLPLPCLVTS